VGSFTLNANGSYSFTPALNYAGPVPVVTYTLSDGQGGTATATLSIKITTVNDAPSGTDKTISFLEGNAYTFNAADFGFSDTNDSPANQLTAVKITSLPSLGSLTLNGSVVSAGTILASSNSPRKQTATATVMPILRLKFKIMAERQTAASTWMSQQTPLLLISVTLTVLR
jgi:hypothetical protein